MEESSSRPDRSARIATDRLDITVRTGAGGGRTLLSAFDHALARAGVADFNLVTLSSVIPPRSRIRMVDSPLAGGHGDLLFCVRSEAYAESPGDTAWAGLGWCVGADGGGLFVEHHGTSEASVIKQIEQSLGDMKEYRTEQYGRVHYAMTSATCVDLPVCAIVLAAYRVSSWFDSASDSTFQPQEDSREPVSGGPYVDRAGPIHGDRSAVLAAEAHSVATPPSTLKPTVSPADTAPTAATVAVLDRDGARDPGKVRITLELALDLATARSYYDLYRATFGELETKAAARQLLHEHEFMEEMVDDRVHKYVAWDDEGTAIGLTTLSTDLETVPWISAPYFANKYPEAYARNAVHYLGFSLVHPGHRRARVYLSMLTRVAETMVAAKGVGACDVCMFNDENGLGTSSIKLFESVADVSIETIDRQTYYACVFHGPR